MMANAAMRTAGAVALGLALVAALVVAGGRRRKDAQEPAMAVFSLAAPRMDRSAAAPQVLHEQGNSSAVRLSMKTIQQDSIEDESPRRPQVSTPFDRQRLVWTGQLSVEVQDVEAAMAGLETLTRDLGGYLIGTELERLPSGIRRGQATLRIPADRYTKAGVSVRSLGKVLAESSNVEDVSKAYADLEAHLKVKQETERRVRELLSQRTGTLKDVLEAEKELARIRGEIDVMEGERRWFEHQVRYSKVTVSLQEPVPLGLSRPSAWASLADAFRDSAGVLADSLAVLFRGLVFLLPWSLIVIPMSMLLRKLRRKGLPASQAAPGP